jgi:hypothetical protein
MILLQSHNIGSDWVLQILWYRASSEEERTASYFKVSFCHNPENYNLNIHRHDNLKYLVLAFRILLLWRLHESEDLFPIYQKVIQRKWTLSLWE